ncbi:uncharacterized protein SPPG_06337 [Spizellomyces punctatus DAOM BR117]|uniref:FHA domain-containing protein n=1 Tax=Spizellomyces punctatus (strain DAOM BR117) TaxID=645134 RepID=A0A0L0HAS1_SPIPD|nr:uncharacterized protein SPPG_06337 [Spizellomyces punctatus DAOM BR117]KNC98655.1 hypothetical protein SPPG_06337 [Spizellomyces punctatus DAOM BR117]|eukprot:XP_016606695.1 hypothetical protein SPPG_06337 [Spizellomyces punctatus DAOM BR117]
MASEQSSNAVAIPTPSKPLPLTPNSNASLNLAKSAPSRFHPDTLSFSEQHQEQPQQLVPPLTVRLQLFPHSDRPAHHSHQHDRHHHHYTAFSFTPVEKDLYPGGIIRIGRKVDRHHVGREKTRRGDKSNNVADGEEEMEFVIGSPPVAELMDEMEVDRETSENSSQEPGETIKRRAEFIAFRSKVVSRTHAELWVGKDGQVFFRDVGSSSGTFLNRLRLSPSGKESIPYNLKNGDVVQLGVDYQGRQEEIYKCVMIKIFITVKVGYKPKLNPHRLRLAVKNLVIAMNPNADSSDPSTHAEASTDCCICLCSISPFQALFLAPCSHCFHYKCVTPLLGSGVMFLCPMCRQVANLEASVAEAENDDEWENPEEEIGTNGSGMELTVNGQASGSASGRPRSVRSVSGKPSQADMDSRIKQILSEADTPVPRVTANDLDALLSDGEGTSDPASTTNGPVADVVGSPPDSWGITLARPGKSSRGVGAPVPIQRSGTKVNHRFRTSPDSPLPVLPSGLSREGDRKGGLVGDVPENIAASLIGQYAAVMDAIIASIPKGPERDEVKRKVAELEARSTDVLNGVKASASTGKGKQKAGMGEGSSDGDEEA